MGDWNLHIDYIRLYSPSISHSEFPFVVDNSPIMLLEFHYAIYGVRYCGTMDYYHH